MVNNNDIKLYAKTKGVYLWKVALAFGCNENNFTKKLHKPLSDDERNRIIEIIDRLAQEK